MSENIWNAWLKRKVEAGTLPYPDYFQTVLKKHGINPAKACQGCIHLVKSYFMDSDSEQHTGHDGHICTLEGGGQEWKPTWPACGQRAEREIKSKKGKQP